MTKAHAIHRSERAWVELGCGRRKIELDGVPDAKPLIGVDRYPFEGVDIVYNLELTPWWWAEDYSCQLIFCHQTLEHIRELIPVMNEVWRICDEDSYVEIVVPYGTSPGALQDPTHVRFFSETTWRYWEPGFVEAFSDYGIIGFFGICAIAWVQDGNLWVILRPLKTAQQLEEWQELRAEGWPRMPAPAWLKDRCPILLGGSDEPV